MKELENILQSTPNGQELLVEFACGDVLGLKDFEMVDASIYGRSDLCVGDVVSQFKCDDKLYRIGSGIEFSLNDVVSATDTVSGQVLYHR